MDHVTNTFNPNKDNGEPVRQCETFDPFDNKTDALALIGRQEQEQTKPKLDGR